MDPERSIKLDLDLIKIKNPSGLTTQMKIGFYDPHPFYAEPDLGVFNSC